MRDVLIGIVAIVVIFVVFSLIAWSGTEDKYVMRDGCIYHKTKELVGGGEITFDIEYTLVTCDSTQFHKYTIE